MSLPCHTPAPRLCYSRRDILQLDNAQPISRNLRRTLWFFKILRPATSRPLYRIPVIITKRPRKRPPSQNPRPPSVLRPLPRADRHLTLNDDRLSFGLLNVRSLNRKVDDLLDLRRELSLDLLLIVETWHDADSVSLRRLRSAGFAVVDRPRPRLISDTLTTNHGGVAVVSAPGIHLDKFQCGPEPSTFEHVCVRVTARSSSCSVMLIYRTGPITPLFFTEFSDLLDIFTSRSEPIVIAGDLNIHLERPSHSWKSSTPTVSPPASIALHTSLEDPSISWLRAPTYHQFPSTLPIPAYLTIASSAGLHHSHVQPPRCTPQSPFAPGATSTRTVFARFYQGQNYVNPQAGPRSTSTN